MTSGLSQNTLVLDTNVLIDFAIWLPFEVNTTFWSVLEKGLEQARWVLLDVVEQEIVGKYDQDLKKWCNEQKKLGLVTAITPANRQRAIEINNQYKMVDDVSGNSAADPYILAFAEAEKITLFSREGKRDNPTKLYKMEEVALLLGIKYTRLPNALYKELNYIN